MLRYKITTIRNSVPIVESYFICAENIWQHKCIQEARIFWNVCLLHIRRSGTFIRSLVDKWFHRPNHFCNTIKCLNYIMHLKVSQCPLNSQIIIPVSMSSQTAWMLDICNVLACLSINVVSSKFLYWNFWQLDILLLYTLVVTHKRIISNVNRRQEKYTLMPHIKDIQKCDTFFMAEF